MIVLKKRVMIKLCYIYYIADIFCDCPNIANICGKKKWYNFQNQDMFMQVHIDEYNATTGMIRNTKSFTDQIPKISNS
jgi:hypothetical protein